MRADLTIAKKSLFALLAVLIVAFVLFIAPKTDAQTAGQSQVLLTWQAHGSYIPSGYEGKALPNQFSTITASVAMIQNGKAIDLGSQTIYWYQDDTLIGGGPGVQHISFTPLGRAPNFTTLKVQISGPGSGLAVHTAQIPVIQPKAVIEAQHPQGEFTANPLSLKATPYFFNAASASSLSYAWSANGNAPGTAEDPELLEVSLDPNTQSGSTLDVVLTITNPADATSASDSTNLTYLRTL